MVGISVHSRIGKGVPLRTLDVRQIHKKDPEEEGGIRDDTQLPYLIRSVAPRLLDLAHSQEFDSCRLTPRAPLRGCSRSPVP
jgi:hypothetical protein